jgi:hypothetical protein
VVSTLHDLSDSWKFSGELGRFPTSDRKVEEQNRIEGEYTSHNAPACVAPSFGSGARRKLTPRCIVNYSTSRRSAIDYSTKLFRMEAHIPS